MQPLLLVAALTLLLVARVQISEAAPQPLATPTTLSDIELTTLSEKSINEDATTASKPKLDDTSPASTSTVLDNRSEEILKNSDLSSTTADVVSTQSDSVTASSVDSGTELSSQPFNESINAEVIESGNGETEKPQISRYVPPLDPVKHMLMMAEAKKLQVSSTEANLESTSVEGFTEKEVSTTEKAVVHLNATDKETTESSELGNVELSTADSVTTILNKNTDTVLYAEPLGTKDSEDDSEASTEVVDKVTTREPTTVLDSETTPVLESNDSSSDILHESSILIKSSELFSGKDDSVVAEVTTDSVESTPSKDSSESTPSKDSSESSMIFSSTSSAIPTEVPDTTVSTTTLEEIQKDGAKEVSSLGHSDEEIVAAKDQVVEHRSEAEAAEEVKSTSTETTSVSTEAVPSTTSTTETDSQTEKDLEKLPSSENESMKNLSLEDTLAFRDGGMSINVSEVDSGETTIAPVEATKEVSSTEYAESTEQSSTSSNAETTPTSIFTTIKELIFPSTTVKPILNNANETEIESFVKDVSEAVPESTTPDLLKEDGSESVSKESSPELLKVELLKSDIDSLTTGSEDVSTELPAVESETKPALVDSEKISDNIENISKPITDELKVNKESLVNEDSQSSTTVLSVISEETTISTESSSLSSSEPVTVTESQDETVTAAIEKYFTNNVSPKDRYVSGNNSDTVAAVQFLHYHDKASSEQCFKLVNAHWNYATNLTDENKKKQLEQTLEYALFHKEAWKNATSFAWKSFNDTLLRRWFKSLSVLGTAALPEDKLNEFNRLKAEMKNVYSTAKVCPYNLAKDKKERALQNLGDCTLTLEPDLTRILTKSRDYDELTYVWKAWRDVAGKPIREKFLRFVNLSNEAARLNGFSDNGDMWREAYESETFESDLEKLWDQLRPLYEHLHAYVRRKLIQQYGNDKIKENGPIPAHLFGNMWAQSWVSLMDIAQPFPGKPSVDVTPIMEAKNMSALEMFKISEEFFTSLGLKEMPEEFWKRSLIEKPKDREIICHASAWDFCNGKDYRIKQCTDITMEDLITVHHEMGHIQYFLQYARQPNVFREGANPGFHEAIGDVLALSVSTPKHLKSIGLLEEVSDDPEGDLNFLLFTALDKVSFLPSGYLIDLWRWGLFSGEIKPEEMNSKWWDLRLKYQGICPPVKRHDTDFDPGAKFHVPGNVPYIRYFVSFVIQFQFHKVLCDAAGHTGPLYKCDIYRSKEAGQILSQVMELGSSEHWSEAMKIMTGGATNRMDAGPILEYFQPLLKFLEQQNKNETLGWMSEDSTICP